MDRMHFNENNHNKKKPLDNKTTRYNNNTVAIIINYDIEKIPKIFLFKYPNIRTREFNLKSIKNILDFNGLTYWTVYGYSDESLAFILFTKQRLLSPNYFYWIMVLKFPATHMITMLLSRRRQCFIHLTYKIPYYHRFFWFCVCVCRERHT